MDILIFFAILLVLVLVHEFGHFFSAKKFGIRVDEFGFGFPPKLFGKKYGETEYTFNLLPFGGFVKIFGEDPEPEPSVRYGAGPNEDGRFTSKPKWQQACVLFAGVFANFLLAWIFFSFGFIFGLPTSTSSNIAGADVKDVHLVVVSVSPSSPAENAGLTSGDKIVFAERDGQSTRYVSPETIRSMVRDGSAVKLGYVRGQNEERFVEITPEKMAQGYAIGIAMDQIGIAKLPPHKAFWEGMRLTVFMTKTTVVGLFGLLWNTLQGEGSLDSVTGPVGMVGIAGDAYEFGFAYLLSFAALISVNLSIINLFPFPALDGGRLFFLFIEAVRGKALSPQKLQLFNVLGFGILLFLMLVVTFNDVAKLF